MRGILRWEKSFSAGNPTPVATLIVVPFDLDLKAGEALRTTTVSARCGFTSGTMKGFEVVAADKLC